MRNSSTISERQRAFLEKAVELLLPLVYPRGNVVRIGIQGSTCREDDIEELSRARAAAVRDQLVTMGLPQAILELLPGTSCEVYVYSNIQSSDAPAWWSASLKLLVRRTCPDDER